MTTHKEALTLALEALERGETELRWKAITAIKDALANHIEDNLAMVAQPEQEPVGHRDGYWCDDLTCKKCYSADFRFKHKNSVDKESLTTEAQQSGSVSNEQVEPSSGKCDADVFEHGTSMGFLNITKEEAEQYCKRETERTGYKHDWHYVAGRVHVKALLSHPPVPTAQPEQEPSYWLGFGLQAHTEKPFDDATPLYTTPPQRTWVGLTNEEYKNLHLQMGSMYFYQDYGRAIEAKLKEKNMNNFLTKGNNNA